MLLEELIAIAFVGVGLTLILTLSFLVRRESHPPPLTETPDALQRRDIEVIDIYNDVAPLPQPQSRDSKESTASPSFVRCTAKVRDRVSGRIYLTRLKLPSQRSW